MHYIVHTIQEFVLKDHLMYRYNLIVFDKELHRYIVSVISQKMRNENVRGRIRTCILKKDHILEPQLLYMAVGGERRIRTFEG